MVTLGYREGTVGDMVDRAPYNQKINNTMLDDDLTIFNSCNCDELTVSDLLWK